MIFAAVLNSGFQGFLWLKVGNIYTTFTTCSNFFSIFTNASILPYSLSSLDFNFWVVKL